MENCIFCKIINGDISSYKVYEDELFFGFLDIHPRSKGHTLLVPKKHHRFVYDVPEMGTMFETAKSITQKMIAKLDAQFVSYITYGMDVEHAHLHIIPRYDSGPVFPPEVTVSPDEMKALVTKLTL